MNRINILIIKIYKYLLSVYNNVYQEYTKYIYTYIHIRIRTMLDNTYKMCVMYPQSSSGLIIISVSLGNFIINLVAAAINLQK